jgi:hypothetical protein
MQVVPIISAIGGGSTAAGAVLVASATAAAVDGIASANAARAAGKHAEAQSVIDANAEGDAAREREIQRKKNLMRAISSQQARAGAVGINFGEGSPAAIANLDIAEAARDGAIDNANTKQRQRSLRSQGRAARFACSTKSATTLLDTAAGFGQVIAGGL